MPKIKPIPDSYMLSHRFRLRNGQWSDWNNAVGQWFGIEPIQKQITMLKRSRPNREMEFSIKYKGQYLDLNGNQIENSFILDSK
jgi:hypothetical protein